VAALGVSGILCALALVAMMGITACAQSKDATACKISIVADGGQWDYTASSKTVESALKEAGVTLGEQDEVYPRLKTAAYDGLKIRVVRVTEKIVTEKEPMKFKTVVKFDAVGNGGRTILQKGETGEKEVQYRVTYRDGEQSGKKAIGYKVIKKPKEEIVMLTRTAFLSSRSGDSLRFMTMVATGYDPGPRSCGRYATGRTATGMHAGHGIVAVDPRVIRLGTKLFVDGYGPCIAGDTGGAIKGNRIDLGFNTYLEALRFGRRLVKVYILD